MPEINLQQLKSQLEALEMPSDICRKFEELSFNDKQLHKHLANTQYAAMPLKIRLTNSRLKDADEIKEKLEILCYHLSLLRTTLLTKDYRTAKKAIHKLFRDELTSMGAVIADIETFKRHIDELDSDLLKLLNANIGLDYKLLLEKEHKRHVARLNNVYVQHTTMVKSIGSLFMEITKHMLADADFKSFLSQEQIPELAAVTA
ncbi:hypothetical protein HYV81_02055 [Candidatus Woesearchaeota archaeon]|nr:hypothetical protein [Candidatus Woesearchaeota archaeon]